MGGIFLALGDKGFHEFLSSFALGTVVKMCLCTISEVAMLITSPCGARPAA